MKDKPVCEVMALIADYAFQRNICMKKYPHGWIAKIDENWTIAVNGGGNGEIEIGPKECMKIKLKPYNWAIWWCGWIAGTGDPFDGILAAGGMANQDTFRQVMENITAREKKG